MIVLAFGSTACGASNGSTSTGVNSNTVTLSSPTTTDTTEPPGSTITAPDATPDRLVVLCGSSPPCDDFASPTGNIICFASVGEHAAREHGFVECEIKSGLVPPPPRLGCELDQRGVVVGSTGSPRLSCRSDPTPAGLDEQIPTLAYGTTWAGFGVSCVSRETGVRCTNRDGHGFSVAREAWGLF
jgi:hypothetical protein